MLPINRFYPGFMLLALVLSLSCSPVFAEDTGAAVPPPATLGAGKADILPVKSADQTDIVIDENNPTHPAVKLTPDKSELIRLDRKPAVVIVGNPAHLNVLPEGQDTLVLVPRAPGATYFTVLDEENKVIMQRHVIVASPKEKYVRIRKSCGGNKDCAPTQVYYCPDMCHEIIMNAESGSQGGSAAASMGQKSKDTGGTSDQEEPASESSNEAPASEDTDTSSEPAE